MNLKRIGILLIFVGIFLSVFFINDKTYLVPALTITVLWFFITLVGFIEDVKKRPSLLKAAVNLPEALKQELKK